MKLEIFPTVQLHQIRVAKIQIVLLLCVGKEGEGQLNGLVQNLRYEAGREENRPSVLILYDATPWLFRIPLRMGDVALPKPLAVELSKA